MKPLNAEDRRMSFLKFTGIFSLTVLLIVIAIFFDMAIVPKKELTYYKEQYKKLSDDVAFDSKLNSQLNDMNNNLILYQNNASNDMAKRSVESGLEFLSGISKKDSTSTMGKLVTQISTGYVVATAAIGKLKDNGSATDQLNASKDELKKCKDDAKDKDQQIQNLTLQLAIYKR